jgi:Flp pilus assembly protein TadD
MTVTSPFALLERRSGVRVDGGAQADDKPMRLAMILVALVAAVPYIATLGYGFVYDDGPIIAGNVALHVPAGLITAWHVAYWPPEWGRAGLFRPVVQFLYALLWNVSGGAPWAFHLYAVVLYAACAVAVLVVLSRALPGWAALLGALLFAAHPLHVESVANVAGSAEVVAALASIACLMVISRAFERTAPAEAVGWRPALATAALYAIALGAKESAATVPGLAALYLWGWHVPGSDSRSARSVIVRGWRAWVACTAALALLIAARGAVLGGFSPPHSAIAVGLDGETFAQRWWTMTAAWPRIAHLLLWPSRLSMHYGPTTVPPYHAPTGIAVVAIVLASAIAGSALVLARRGDRRPLVAIGWIALAYLAASNILVPTGQLLAERTLYFSSVGAVMLAGWMLARAETMPVGARRSAATLVLATVLLGTLASTRRARVWSSDERLFQSGIDFDSDAFYPYWQLARAVGRNGDNGRGLALLGEAYRRNPQGETLALEYAQHLRMSGRGEDALVVLRTMSATKPRSQAIRLAYLDLLLERRGPDSVIATVDDYRGVDPAGALRFVVLATAYEKMGRTDLVTSTYSRAVAEDANDPGLRYAYARALHASHREDDAQRQLDSAAASGAMPVVARYSLQARISLARGDSAGARRALGLARAVAPGDTALSALDSMLATAARR